MRCAHRCVGGRWLWRSTVARWSWVLGCSVVAGAAVWFPLGSPLGTEGSALSGYVRAFGRRIVIVSQYQSVAVRDVT